MGFRLTWLSIRGKQRAAIFRDLGLRTDCKSITHVVEGVVGRPHADDAYLVLAMDDRGRHLEPDLLRTVSFGASVVVCHVHEGCMCSHAALWADGNEIWRVEHDSDQGIRHLAIIGDPPPELGRIRAAQEKAQDDEPPRKRLVPRGDAASGIPPDLALVVAQYNQKRAAQGASAPALPAPMSMGVDHIFNIPVDLCEALTGLRHERASFWHGPAFEVLEATT